jgi:hypothetical protein
VDAGLLQRALDCGVMNTELSALVSRSIFSAWKSPSISASIALQRV